MEKITLTRRSKTRFSSVIIARRAVEEDGTLISYCYYKNIVSIMLDDPEDKHDFDIEIPNSVILQIAKSLKQN